MTTIQELWWGLRGHPEKAAEDANAESLERLSHVLELLDLPRDDYKERVESLDWTTTDSVAVLEKRARIAVRNIGRTDAIGVVAELRGPRADANDESGSPTEPPADPVPPDTAPEVERPDISTLDDVIEKGGRPDGETRGE
jgi:hypothetical protein